MIAAVATTCASASDQRGRLVIPMAALATAGASVNPVYRRAYGDAMRFRTTYVWPDGGVDKDASRVKAIIANCGDYVLVMFTDTYLHKDAQGNAVMGCEGVEYYRVDPSNDAVAPFDGCVESHRRVLPALGQLPPAPRLRSG